MRCRYLSEPYLSERRRLWDGSPIAFGLSDKLTDVDASLWTPRCMRPVTYGSSAVSEILKAGAKVITRSKRGETVRMASAVAGMADENLVDAGAEVNAVNDVGMTALMLLVQRGEPEEIATMLKAGANARKKDARGGRPWTI